MILPKDVKTRSKFRDAKIINDWLSGQTQESLALVFKLRRWTIWNIIRKNRDVIKLDANFAKITRIHYLQNSLANSLPSEKDRLDIIEALRKEYDGDKSQVNQVNVIQVSLESSSQSEENYLLESSPRPAEKL